MTDFAAIWALTPPPEVPWAPNPMTIRIVDDEACPHCGRYGRPKVETDGIWAWKCPTSYDQCGVGYYYPGTNRRPEMKLTPEKAAEQNARIKAEIDELMTRSRWISRGNTSRIWPKDEALPEGWTEGTMTL